MNPEGRLRIVRAVACPWMKEARMSEPTHAIVSETRDDVTVVRFTANEVTEATGLSQAYEELKELVGKAKGKMLFSLANVNFISSAGISALLWLSEQLRSEGGKLRLCGAQPDVFQVFKIGRLDTVLNFCESEKDALEAFKRGA